MDMIIKGLESVPFSGSDIMQILNNKSKIMRYSDLTEFNHIDEVLSPYDNVVILYETKPNYGHWVCIMKHHERRPYLEFFDSYGLAPDEQLRFIKHGFRSPVLTQLLSESRYPVIYNKQQLQDDYHNVSTCGRHVCMRLIMMEYPLSSYLRMFKSNKNRPDEIVTYLTAFQE